MRTCWKGEDQNLTYTHFLGPATSCLKTLIVASSFFGPCPSELQPFEEQSPLHLQIIKHLHRPPLRRIEDCSIPQVPLLNLVPLQLRNPPHLRSMSIRRRQGGKHLLMHIRPNSPSLEIPRSTITRYSDLGSRVFVGSTRSEATAPSTSSSIDTSTAPYPAESTT
ncbi:hypothetical protein VTN00DRAFT_6727 [Thermoascus crustaceus]|uniref:uncharacterized protein n=1 Tax=Thermoascus crustaceus TaxID=5088 RepID=UPI003742F019